MKFIVKVLNIPIMKACFFGIVFMIFSILGLTIGVFIALCLLPVFYKWQWIATPKDLCKCYIKAPGNVMKVTMTLVLPDDRAFIEPPEVFFNTFSVVYWLTVVGAVMVLI